jgi:DNA-binding transcriptional MerR regulator
VAYRTKAAAPPPGALDLAPTATRTVVTVTAPPDRLTIGQVARLSGLTTRALRHYDKLGVLRPAEVSGGNGYRWYAREQVEIARHIRVLRELEVPLDEIRRILADPRSDDAAQRIAAHRRRIHARLMELRTTYYFLGKLAGGKEIDDVMPLRPTDISLEAEARRKTAADLFNYTWTLMEKAGRTERETDLMVHAAHASRFMWEEIGEPVNHARGEWQIARVYAVVDRPEPALHHAHRCLEIVEEFGVGDFDLACAYEAMARAHATAGEEDAARRYAALGRETAARIADADDRALVVADLDSLP